MGARGERRDLAGAFRVHVHEVEKSAMLGRHVIGGISIVASLCTFLAHSPPPQLSHPDSEIFLRRCVVGLE